MIIEREKGFLIFLFCASFLKESDVLPYIAFFYCGVRHSRVRPFCKPRLGAAGTRFHTPGERSKNPPSVFAESGNNLIDLAAEMPFFQVLLNRLSVVSTAIQLFCSKSPLEGDTLKEAHFLKLSSPWRSPLIPPCLSTLIRRQCDSP